MAESPAPIVDPLLDDVVADTLRERGHRPARIAVVGCGGRPLARELCERHPGATVVSAGAEDDHPAVRLVADGPFDLIVTCPRRMAAESTDMLAVCRAALVDRGLAIALVDPEDDRLAAAAAIAGFDVETHALSDRRVLVAMRP